ncbi:tetratricopeptide repeat protein [Arcobacter sp. LA11]|uniref:tetratricopeptide repeat protein n=1 Tax=Arcobacter sp. LA11 TaxID=1898176 RepID=UPI000932F634|nr:tetratricopeptide repeat protein [Arcobacter sp. LA11]
MKLILIICVLFSLLNSNDIQNKYQLGFEIKIDFNNDGLEDKIVHYIAKNQNEYNLIKIYSKNHYNEYKLVIEKKLENFKNRPYSGYLVNKDNKDMILSLSKPNNNGGDIEKYFFKFTYKKGEFLLDNIKYIELNMCNFEVMSEYLIKKDYIKNKSFKEFNFLKVFNILEAKKNKEKIFIKQIGTKEEYNYNKMTLIYKKGIEYLKEYIKKNIIIEFNDLTDEKCKPIEYMDKYLFLDIKNLNKSNNIAYYLERAGYYKESIYLLEKIIEKYPSRTVAYINLGDSYLKDGNKKEAIKNYQIYVKQMKEKNKEKKIPKRVLEEINSSELKVIPEVKTNTSKIESIKKEEKTFFTKLLELFGSSSPDKNINIMQS